jgi:hypothetical protein
LAETVTFSLLQLFQVVAAPQQGVEFSGSLVHRVLRRRLYGGCIPSQHQRILAVGLGTHALPTRPLAHLIGIDQRDQPLLGIGKVEQAFFVATGWL